MNATIQKWGNSQGIRLPKIILDQLNFRENDKVEVIASEDCIILRKAEKPKHITLQDRLEAFYGKPIEQIDSVEITEEVDTGSPVGEEVW